MLISPAMALETFRSIALFPLRLTVFAVGFTAYWMETAADFLVGASSTSEYVRVGRCSRCGKCCAFLALEMPPSIAKRPWLVRIFNCWHDAALNFEPAGVYDNFLAYRCRYYRGEGADGRCSIYPFRHRLCRFFPRQHLYGRIDLSSDCGFSFVRRSVARRLKAKRKEGATLFEDVLRGKDGKTLL